MESDTIIIERDSCFTKSIDKINIKHNIGSIVINKMGFYFWKNEHYETLLREKKIVAGIDNILVFYCDDDNEYSIPENTEILVYDYRNKIKIKNFPSNLKTFCLLGSININVTDINFPIGLKYLCLFKYTDPEIINKMKIPFGCKIIKFSL
jgi:hypothetical protein